MGTNEKISTFAAFCELITEYALINEDFVLLTTDEVTETEPFERLPQEKFIRTGSRAENALMRAAGLAIAGKKPWLNLWGAATRIYAKLSLCRSFPSA